MSDTLPDPQVVREFIDDMATHFDRQGYTSSDLMYFSLNFAHVEWMVHVNDIHHPFLLVDNTGRELNEATARRLAEDYEGAVFNWGVPVAAATPTREENS